MPLSPDVPAVPLVPDVPVVPDVPFCPEVPDEPKYVPLIPEVPAVPDVKPGADVPEEPAVPLLPKNVPLTPEVPDTPDVPDVPFAEPDTKYNVLVFVAPAANNAPYDELSKVTTYCAACTFRYVSLTLLIKLPDKLPLKITGLEPVTATLPTTDNEPVICALPVYGNPTPLPPPLIDDVGI